MTWIVAYDISKNRRRTRLAKRLVAKGIRLQKSVFFLEGSMSEVNTFMRELEQLIDIRTDQLCAWPLMETWRERQLCYPPEAAPLQETFVIG
jgi:CRISPR-associated endonuclease Cas2